MSDELKTIGDKDVEALAGGYIFNTHDHGDMNPWNWEVIDANGDVVASFQDKETAEQAAKKLGLSTKQLSWSQLQQLRGEG